MILSKSHTLTAEAEKSVSHPKRARHPAAYVGGVAHKYVFSSAQRHSAEIPPYFCTCNVKYFKLLWLRDSSCCGFAIYTVMFLLIAPRQQQQGGAFLFEAQSHSLECGLNAR